MRAILFAIISTILTAGCTAEYGAGYATGAYTTDVAYAPDLVTVSPGVQVIADWNEPIFFVDGIYWRFYGGTWYRSGYYTGDWVYAAPPPALIGIEPHRYAHYRPYGWTPRYREARPARPIVRDHRTPPLPPPPRHDRDRGHDRDHRH